MATLTKSIKEVLDIQVEFNGDKFIADAKILSGTPCIGKGKTEYEALYDLLAKLMFQVGTKSDKSHCEQWHLAIEKFWEEFRST